MLKILLKTSEFLEKIVSIFGKVGSWLAIPLISIIIFDIITRRFFVLGSTKLQEMEWHLHTSLFLLVLGCTKLGAISNKGIKTKFLSDILSWGILILSEIYKGSIL